jgi:hypothetical protein
MIIGLAGYARSGKDEVAKILVNDYGFRRVAFADAIREFLLRVNPILENGNRLNETVKEIGWDLAKSRDETRRLLQEVGVTARDMFGQDFWVGIALKKLEFQSRIVVSDVRFKNEVYAIQQLEGKVFRVMREGVGPINNHVSETEIDDVYVNGYIPNNGTLEDLQEYVHNLMRPYANKIV